MRKVSFRSMIILFLLMLSVLLTPDRSHAAPGDYLFGWDVNSPADGAVAGVAVDNGGNVYVVDFANNTVEVFSSVGQHIRTIGVGQPEVGQLLYLRGLVVDSSGNVFVADDGKSRVAVYTSDGAFVREIGTSGDWRLALPCGVALDRSGKLYVADYEAIKVYSSTGDLLMVIDPWQGPLVNHSWVAVAGNGNIYEVAIGIIGAEGENIKIFSSSGIFIGYLSSQGRGDGQYASANGLAVDRNDNIYIGDSGLNRIQVFSPDGSYLGSIAGIGDMAPASLAVGGNGLVYARNFYQNRIEVFEGFAPNSPAGSDVAVQPIDVVSRTAPVTLTFPLVIQPGTTALVVSATGPALPAGYTLGNAPLYYLLTTTATFTPPATICVDYDPSRFTGSDPLRLLHYADTSWHDVTSSINLAGHVICGEAATLSPFVVAQQVVTYTLSLRVSGSGTGTVSGAGTYNAGTTSHVTATPSAGSTFTGWSGDCSGGAAALDVVMDADKTCVANFELLDVPDLTVAMSHKDYFKQGKGHAVYDIVVRNVGTLPTTGVVSVTDVLPAGLAARSLRGKGWVCSVETLTCTRSDAVPAGGSYPPITLAVRVADDAPAVVVNRATVAGGGEVDTANDTVVDETAVDPKFQKE